MIFTNHAKGKMCTPALCSLLYQIGKKGVLEFFYFSFPTMHKVKHFKWFPLFFKTNSTDANIGTLTQLHSEVRENCNSFQLRYVYILYISHLNL